MDLSITDPGKLTVRIQEHMGRKFSNPAHVCFLFTASAAAGKLKHLADIMFTAKYVTGLKRIASYGSYTEDEYVKKIFSEFNTNVQKFITMLDDLLDESEEPEARELRTLYLKMDQESLARSLVLAEDLSLCKEYFNRIEDSEGKEDS
ncbi:MAG: hypothetical protein K1X85_03015 [Ignavibacteria bacterium]|nr:hypothetical protein [Ignavibacteria bacterium]